MKRRNIAAVLVGLFVGLIVTVNAPAVGASRDCTGYAQEQCEAMVAAQDAAPLFAAPVHILGGKGIGQEHFEAIAATGAGTFVIAAPVNATVTSAMSGDAPGTCARMAPTIPSD
jgi:hypothetical protein